MTKILTGLLATLIAIFFLTGCGPSDNNGGEFVDNNLTKPKTAKKVEVFSGDTENVKINLSDFFNTAKVSKVSGEFVSRETDDIGRITKATASVWYNGIFEVMDIPLSENFVLKLPNAENVEFYISLRNNNDKGLFYGYNNYSGNPERLRVEMNYNDLRYSQMYVYTDESILDLPYNPDSSELSVNSVVYFEDGTKMDSFSQLAEGDETGFKLSKVWVDFDGQIQLDNSWSLKNLPIKMVLLESGEEIYFDFQLSQFAVNDKTVLWEKEIETEISLLDPRLKAFKEGVVYNGGQDNISFITNEVYYLICKPLNENDILERTLIVNGDSYAMYPEPIYLEVGMQNISVTNLSGEEEFEIKIIPEEEYLDGLLGEEVSESKSELPYPYDVKKK